MQSVSNALHRSLCRLHAVYCLFIYMLVLCTAQKTNKVITQQYVNAIEMDNYPSAAGRPASQKIATQSLCLSA